MDMLDDDELAGVIGHELAHIYGKDILIGTIVAMMAGTIMTIVDIFQWSMILGGGSSDDEEGGNPLGFNRLYCYDNPCSTCCHINTNGSFTLKGNILQTSVVHSSAATQEHLHQLYIK